MVLKCYSIAFLFNWWIMKILNCFFIMHFFGWLNVWMHLSVEFWISCYALSQAHFKESLCFCSITQVSSLWGEGAQDSCFCYSSHALLPHCKHPEYWQQKAAISAPFCEPMCEVHLGGKGKICKPKRRGHRELGERQ